MAITLTVARHWADMIKLSHSIFAAPFALLATFLAARPLAPTAEQLLWIVICMVAARSAAMTFNRLVDAEIDARNPRTSKRHIPAGVIRRETAWVFFFCACALFLLGCGAFLWRYGNPWPVRLAAPTLAFICLYSYAKRFTRWSHLVLGAAIAFSPVAAWIAINPATLGAPAWALMAAGACWIAGFDIIYACQDAAFDRESGLKSLPASLGVGPALWVARALHALTVVALLLVGQLAGLGALYLTGVGAVSLLLLIENALVSPHDLSRVNLAFFTINGVVGVLLGVMGVLDVLLA